MISPLHKLGLSHRLLHWNHRDTARIFFHFRWDPEISRVYVQSRLYCSYIISISKCPMNIYFQMWLILRHIILLCSEIFPHSQTAYFIKWTLKGKMMSHKINYDPNKITWLWKRFTFYNEIKCQCQFETCLCDWTSCSQALADLVC